MSYPVSSCMISKAARGDEAAYQRLLECMRYNLRCGHWSTFPCRCSPPCPVPTDAELEALNQRLEKDLGEGAGK